MAGDTAGLGGKNLDLILYARPRGLLGSQIVYLVG